MKQLPIGLLAIAGLWLTSICGAADNSFRMTAIFSDQAGLYQYIQLQESSGLDNQHRFTSLTLEARSRNGVVKSITFPNDLPSSLTTGRTVLIGTTHAGAPDVDFTLPLGFLPTDGGTLVFAGVDTWNYGVLPANGYTVLLRDNTLTTNASCCAGLIFRPFNGAPTGLIALINPVIEYYNTSLDHYFMSSSQPDIDALDSGRIPGWQRTGESFPAWIAPLEFLSMSPPNMGPVCRLYIPLVDSTSQVSSKLRGHAGDSHFFSASVAECNEALARHDLVLETSRAFYASLPNAQTGECLYDQTPVYRLWNRRIDSNHRYTSSPAIRDLMLSQGYVAEGYGPNPVAMCVGGGIFDETP